MELLLYVDGRCVARTAIDHHRLNVFSYLTSLKQYLVDLNCDAVEAAKEDPQFFIEGLPSSMNFFVPFDVDELLRKTLYPPNYNKNKE